MRSPKVSVIMSVYNGEKFLEEALESILKQTFPDYEFIIINDGSTDRTPQILASFDDPRLVIVNQDNRGLTVSLNRGIRLAKGTYIARMDADDISEPTRLERQVEVLDHDPDVVLVACWYKVIDEKGNVLAHRRLPTDGRQLAKLLMHDNPICHGSVLLRKEAIEAVGSYDENLRYAQDYDLWLRMLRKGYSFSIVPEFLYRFRISPESVAKLYLQRRYAALIKMRQAEKCKNIASNSFENLGTLSYRRKRSLYHYAIGTLKLEDGQTKAARGELLKSVRIDPSNIRSWYRLTVSFLPPWMRNPISGAVRYARDVLVSLRWR
ncbi:MAG TPA: glycosyltransferase [Deltaproteobacteria bacterium]|nr:glycosyltransferase [Deltaproteobacteria bacterium]